VTLHQNKVEQEGEKGSKSLSYDYTSKNGVVIRDIFRGEQMLKEAVNRVVLEGTRPIKCDFSWQSIGDAKLAEMINSGEILRDVTHLDLSSNNITDISPLKSLTGLTELNLKGNTINNITPLSSLTNLTTLNLTSNTINNITPLNSLTNLTTLNLSNNRNITDYSPLKSLRKLKELDIRENNGVSQLVTIANDLSSSGLQNCTITYQ
jgi:hypothetical protein